MSEFPFFSPVWVSEGQATGSPWMRDVFNGVEALCALPGRKWMLYTSDKKDMPTSDRISLVNTVAKIIVAGVLAYIGSVTYALMATATLGFALLARAVLRTQAASLFPFDGSGTAKKQQIADGGSAAAASAADEALDLSDEQLVEGEVNVSSALFGDGELPLLDDGVRLVIIDFNKISVDLDFQRFKELANTICASGKQINFVFQENAQDLPARERLISFRCFLWLQTAKTHFVNMHGETDLCQYFKNTPQQGEVTGHRARKMALFNDLKIGSNMLPRTPYGMGQMFLGGSKIRGVFPSISPFEEGREEDLEKYKFNFDTFQPVYPELQKMPPLGLVVNSYGIYHNKEHPIEQDFAAGARLINMGTGEFRVKVLNFNEEIAGFFNAEGIVARKELSKLGKYRIAETDLEKFAAFCKKSKGIFHYSIEGGNLDSGVYLFKIDLELKVTEVSQFQAAEELFKRSLEELGMSEVEVFPAEHTEVHSVPIGDILRIRKIMKDDDGAIPPIKYLERSQEEHYTKEAQKQAILEILAAVLRGENVASFCAQGCDRSPLAPMGVRAILSGITYPEGAGDWSRLSEATVSGYNDHNFFMSSIFAGREVVSSDYDVKTANATNSTNLRTYLPHWFAAVQEIQAEYPDLSVLMEEGHPQEVEPVVRKLFHTPVRAAAAAAEGGGGGGKEK